MPSYQNHNYRILDAGDSDVISQKSRIIARCDSSASMKSVKKEVKALSIFAKSSFVTQVSDSEIKVADSEVLEDEDDSQESELAKAESAKVSCEES